jgi:WS/DGAT/MGAT family acyltransferase
VIDGLEGGRVAFAFKMHHAIADGGASVRVLEEVFGALEPPPHVPRAERVPSTARLLLFALRRQLATWAGLPKMLARTLASLRAGRAREKQGAAPVTRPLTGPKTRFNKAITPERIYVDVTVPLADLKTVKDTLNATLNDVFIEVCGGALRRFLEKRGELPEGDLTGTSPVSLRTEEELGTYGNRISYWYATLAPDADTARARLEGVRKSTSAARDWAQGDRSLFSDWQNHYTFFRLFSVKLLAMVERRTGKPAFNAIVSNVRGPRPLSFEGAPVVAVRSMGPIVGSQGLNFTGWSYGDDLSIGIHSTQEIAPDLRELATCVLDELEDLKETARAHTDL